MQYIKQIKKELSGFEEIELPYNLKKDQSYTNFITLKNDEESVLIISGEPKFSVE